MDLELNGKKIAFLGDSITEGHGLTDLDALFWRRIARSTGAQCFGYGIGGTRIAPRKRPSADPRHDLYFGSRVKDMIPDADIIVVFGGTNDFGHGDVPMGQITDCTEETFCGAYHCLCRQLIERYPHSQIVIMTPLHRIEESTVRLDDFGNPRSGLLQDYVDRITAIAGHYGIPVLDLFRTSGLQPLVPISRALYMPDGLHPNEEGNAIVARKVEAFLRALG